MSRPDGVDMAAAAQEYGQCGWSVFPCKAGGKRPLTTRGFHDATHDVDRIRWLWIEHPNANIAAVVPAQTLVLDVDGDEGSCSLAALEAKHQKLPETLICHTGGGGRHFYFTDPRGVARQTVGFLGPGLDTRKSGRGYVVVPPSLHAAGRRYRWHNVDVPASPLPRWLGELLRIRTRSRPSVPGRPIWVSSRYAQAALDGEIAKVVAARVRTRNTTLYVAALKLGSLVGDGLLSEGDVTSALLNAARLNGYTATDGERAAIKTIASGLEYGVSHPRGVAP